MRLYCQVTSQRDLFKRREAGAAKIEFGKACDGLLGSSRLAALSVRLKDQLGDSIFDQRKGPADPGGWARRLFSKLSEYEHCRPNFRNVDMWESNGPVFSPKAFARFARAGAPAGQRGERTVGKSTHVTISAPPPAKLLCLPLCRSLRCLRNHRRRPLPRSQPLPRPSPRAVVPWAGLQKHPSKLRRTSAPI